MDKTEDFIQKAKLVHGDKYDYSKVEYKNSKTKVIIICPEHGEFEQTPDHHLHGAGCAACAGNKKLTTNQFISDAIKIHVDKYDYSKIEYANNYTKVCIICPAHGEFWQTPSNHLRGKGCPKCKANFFSLNYRKTVNQFISDAIKIHGDKYDYSKVNYIDAHAKVCITCNKHGDFWQKPNNHLQGQGCPICSVSKGEKDIELFLVKYNINFEIQKKFEDCKNINPLPFDFYLPDYNLCIEFQGEQHYIPIEHFGGENTFKQQQINDAIKRGWCSKEENPNLLEIKYTENIEQVLEEALCLSTMNLN